MNVLLFNIKTDSEDDILGFTTRWINALAERVDQIWVVTMMKGTVEVRDNVEVYSVGKERDYSEVRRAVRFYRITLQLIKNEDVDAVFAHMIPIFAILFAPLSKLFRIPVLLWYAHKTVNWRVRLAHRLSDRVVTSTKHGFQLKSNKVHIVGQGIDTETFAPEKSNTTPPYRIMYVGRLSPVKNCDRILQAAEVLIHEHKTTDVHFDFVGAPPPGRQRNYLEQLKEDAETRDLQEKVTFHGSIPHSEIVEYYHQCDIFINLSDTESLDKTGLEAMACEKFILTSNRSYLDLLDDRFIIRNLEPDHIAKRMHESLDLLRNDEVDEQRAELRRIVQEHHSLHQLMDNIYDHLKGLSD